MGKVVSDNSTSTLPVSYFAAKALLGLFLLHNPTPVILFVQLLSLSLWSLMLWPLIRCRIPHRQASLPMTRMLHRPTSLPFTFSATYFLLSAFMLSIGFMSYLLAISGLLCLALILNPWWMERQLIPFVMKKPPPDNPLAFSSKQIRGASFPGSSFTLPCWPP